MQINVRGILGRIDFLLGRVYPYRSSKIALQKIRTVFETHEKSLRNAPREDIYVEQLSRIVMYDAYRFLYIIELIANSSDVHSVFEFQEPFWELTSKIIKPKEIPSIADIHLIITSSSRYSPFVLRSVPDVLPNFILISLPASEIHNPLLFPLAGHELGHVVWNIFRSQDEDIIAVERLVKQICSDSSKPVAKGQQLNILLDKKMSELQRKALRHVIELFCDCFGLRLFGEGFLYAFLYFFLPLQQEDVANPTHPISRIRLSLLKRACQQYKISHAPLPSTVTSTISYSEPIYNRVYSSVSDRLINLADKVVRCAASNRKSDPQGSEKEKNRILGNFQRMQPAVHAKTLSDIINAGWDMYNCNNTTRKIETNVLFDLIAKSFEVMALEKRIRS